MTEDTENRVNTPGGEPEEERTENGVPETNGKNADENTGAENGPESQKTEEGTACDSGKGSDDEKSEPESASADGYEDTCGNENTEQDAEPHDDNKDNKSGETAAVLKDNERLKSSLDSVNEQLKKQRDVFMRTMAEYDNYRKRTEREKAAIYSDATAAAVKEILSVEDNLTRALEQKECSAEDLRKGVEMVEKQMQKALEKLGVTEMGKTGEPFDPALHNAVSHIEDENIGENTIAEVFQKGYMIGDKVVRHAMVKVAN